MTSLVAWRLLTDDKGRSGLAVTGLVVAILLMFLQLGIYMSVPQGGLLFYKEMRFDLMMTSTAYVFEARPASFPRRRLLQALADPEVMRVAPVYHERGRWLNDERRIARDVFVIGFNPNDAVFYAPEIGAQTEALRQADTVLVDAASRPELGALTLGRTVEVDERRLTIAGIYHLGTGFLGLGLAVTSDLNFVRIFSSRSLSEVSLGLITLKPGADPERVAARLRELMLPDTQVLTRREIMDKESEHWLRSTSTGLIFGFGVAVAIVIGIVILNQTLSTQITRQLPQYATLKAIGYTDRSLRDIVVSLAILTTSLSYVPAALLALVVYWIIRGSTLLPIDMTVERLLGVLATTWAMSALSATSALRALRRADPAELF